MKNPLVKVKASKNNNRWENLPMCSTKVTVGKTHRNRSTITTKVRETINEKCTLIFDMNSTLHRHYLDGLCYACSSFHKGSMLINSLQTEHV